jgi:hypothetical protein
MGRPNSPLIQEMAKRGYEQTLALCAFLAELPHDEAIVRFLPGWEDLKAHINNIPNFYTLLSGPLLINAVEDIEEFAESLRHNPHHIEDIADACFHLGICRVAFYLAMQEPASKKKAA